MSTPISWPQCRVGIIGGGQLAKMMTQKAKRLGFTVVILDPVESSPAGQIADEQIVGGYRDAAAIAKLCERVDVVTFDLENVDADVLGKQRDLGVEVHPSPEAMLFLQDKLLQRDMLAAADVAQPRYGSAEPTPAELEEFGFPLVQKLRRGGYDGRGVQMLHSSGDEPLEGPSILEEKIAIDKELAVMVARSRSGEVRVYPVVEMEFDHEANILDLLLAPARISEALAEQAKALAVKCVETLGAAGVFGVELFLAKDGQLLVNEIAPRPHNSGHFTYEACVTCQFEQHIRAVVGLPLGSTRQMSPAVVVNLLGAGGDIGPLAISGLEDALRIEGVALHVYGKSETKPKRKMGHATVLDTDLERARTKALNAKDLLQMKTKGSK